LPALDVQPAWLDDDIRALLGDASEQHDVRLSGERADGGLVPCAGIEPGALDLDEAGMLGEPTREHLSDRFAHPLVVGREHRGIVGHDHDGPGLALRAGHAGRETEEQTHEHQRREPNPMCAHRRASLSVFRAM